MNVLGKNFQIEVSALTTQTKFPQPGYELEIRFGSWERDGKFKSSIKKEEYQNLVDNLGTGAKRTLSAIWLSSGTGHRTSFQLDPINNKVISKKHQKKENIAKQDFKNFGFRVSIKKEIELDTNPQIRSTNLIRYLDRLSWNIVPGWRVDLSQVISREFSNFQGAEKAWKEMSQGKLSFENYELEIEYVEKVPQFIEKMAEAIVKVKDILIPDFQLYKVRNEIFQTIQGLLQISGRDIDFRRDLTDNPVSLRFSNMGDLETLSYSATEKADGTRKLLWIDNNGMGYFLTSANDIEPVGKFSDSVINNLIDGEYIEEKYYACFDLLIHNGKDIRTDPHHERLSYLEVIMKSIKFKKLNIFMKKFYFPVKEKEAISVNAQVEQGTKRIYDLARKVLEAKYPYKIDGIIFTPIDARYKDPQRKIYKWKPPDETTIDFLVKQVGNNQYQLFVGIHRDSFKRNRFVLPKNYRLLFPEIEIQKINYFPVPFYPRSHYENGIKDDNFIGEFRFDKKEDRWVLTRVREDRTAEYRKYGRPYGNDWETALTNWEIIIQPITERMITGREKIPFFIDKGERDLSIQAMKKFHNYLKLQLYKKYIEKTNWLLEVAAGRMGDLQKWIEVGVKNVLAVDIDSEAIQEGKRRIAGLGKKISVKIFDQQADFGEPFNPAPGTTNAFDQVVCNFAVHFFMGGELTFNQFIENIDKYLKKKGHLVLTSLDGHRVNHFFEKNKIEAGDIYEFIKDGKRILALKKLYQGYTVANLSQEMLSFIITIGSVQSEYLVNFDYLKEVLKKKKYKIIEDSGFEEYYRNWLEKTQRKWGELSEVEKEYSFMNRVLVALKP